MDGVGETLTRLDSMSPQCEVHFGFHFHKAVKDKTPLVEARWLETRVQ